MPKSTRPPSPKTYPLPDYLIYRSILTGRSASRTVHDLVDDVIIPVSPGTMPEVFVTGVRPRIVLST
jgi:hypothetical protein